MGFLSLDGTFWIQLINFAIFFLLLERLFLRPVGEAIRRRREYIDGVQRDYRTYANEVKALRTQAGDKRAAARRAAEDTVAKARASAETEAEQIGAAESARAQAIIDEARGRVASEVHAAKGREDELSERLAQTLLARALGASG